LGARRLDCPGYDRSKANNTYYRGQGKEIKIATELRDADYQIVADVAEALIGAAYVSTERSLEGALQAIHDLHIPLKNLKTWGDIHGKVAQSNSGKKRKEPGGDVTLPVEGWMQAFKPPPAKFFGYVFKDEQMIKDIMVCTPFSVSLTADGNRQSPETKDDD
jgi:hypothetical protein